MLTKNRAILLFSNKPRPGGLTIGTKGTGENTSTYKTLKEGRQKSYAAAHMMENGIFFREAKSG